MSVNTQIASPKIGEGIFLIKDVSKILNLDYDKVRRWIVGYWGSGDLEKDVDYTFGDKGNKAINFYSLIEFYTFFKLREKGVTANEIRKAHSIMSKELNTPYPFASADSVRVGDKPKKKKTTPSKKASIAKPKKLIWYNHLENIITADGKHQPSFKFIEEFLERIEFDKNNVAKRFFPLDDSRNIVVDPKHQFGQPTIIDTNIKTQTIFNLYKGGETNDNICILYDLSPAQVQDAISYHKNVA